MKEKREHEDIVGIDGNTYRFETIEVYSGKRLMPGIEEALARKDKAISYTENQISPEDLLDVSVLNEDGNYDAKSISLGRLQVIPLQQAKKMFLHAHSICCRDENTIPAGEKLWEEELSKYKHNA